MAVHLYRKLGCLAMDLESRAAGSCDPKARARAFRYRYTGTGYALNLGLVVADRRHALERTKLEFKKKKKGE